MPRTAAGGTARAGRPDGLVPVTAGDASLPSLFAPGRLVDQKYRVVQRLGGGNSGEVFSVTSVADDRRLALKVFVPFFEVRQLATGEIGADLTSAIIDSTDFSGSEHRFLSHIDHPFIVQVFATGTVSLDKSEGDHLRGMLSRRRNPPAYAGKAFTLPYIVTSQVDGARLDIALESQHLGREDAPHVLRALMGVAQGLEYLHATHRYLHADVKPANIVIRDADWFPVLIDFALCKNLNFEGGEVDPEEFVHRPQLDWTLTPDKQLLPTDALYRLMREGGTRQELRDTLFPWLDFYQFGALLRDLLPRLVPVLQAPDFAYVESLAADLTNWSHVTLLRSGDLVSRVERIGSRHIYSVPLPDSGDVRFLPSGVKVVVPTELGGLAANVSFSRLTLVNQLSFLAFVTEGAKHARSLHAYDTLRVAQLLTSKLSQTPMFRQLFARREVLQLWAVAMLHDINHIPFLHILAESRLPGLDSVPMLDIACDGRATGELAAGRPSVYELLSELGIAAARFRRLLVDEWHDQSGDTAAVDEVVMSVIRSGVDIDKLSYLVLDSAMTGLGTAQGLHVEELLDAATIAEITDTDNGHTGYHLAFRMTGLSQVEAALNARLQSFQQVYWRSENRALMAMFLSVIRQLFLEGDVTLEAFISESLFLSDFAFVRRLDQLAGEKLDRPGTLAATLLDRSRWPVPVWPSARLHNWLTRKSLEEREALQTAVRDELCRLAGIPVEADRRVVLDIPERDLDLGGAVYIEVSPGKGKSILEVSQAVGQIKDRYHELSRTATVFVDPVLNEAITAAYAGDRVAVAKAVESAFGAPKGELT